MLTRQQIIQQAVEAGLGGPVQLGYQFDKFTKSGLLSLSSGKERRRGGAGLWHANQGDLFRTVLTQRARGVRSRTLLNLPVAAWLMGLPGLETAQAQRAFCSWLHGSSGRPTGDRSLQVRSIDAFLDYFCDKDAPRSARIRLKKLLRIFVESNVIESREFETAAAHCAFPGEVVSGEQKQIVSALKGIFDVMVLAENNADILCAATSSTEEFWNWSGRSFRATMQQYLEAVPQLRKSKETGRLYEPLAASDIANQGCALLLRTFGYGIRGIMDGKWPESLEKPPKLEKIRGN